jgi:hypothetical protein
MENFIVNGTHNLPAIFLDPDIGAFAMKGRLLSISDEQFLTFQNMLEWINQYALQPAKTTNFDIDLEFCSSGGIKFIFQIFKILETVHIKGNPVSIVWHYEPDDDDNGDKGYQLQKLLKIPVTVVANED